MSYDKSFGVFSAFIQRNLYDISDEHQRFLSSGNHCPKCNKKLINSWTGRTRLAIFSADGHRLPSWQGPALRGEVLECLECGYKWRYRNNGNAETSERFDVISIVENNRTEESIGEDKRIIDNSRSPGSLKRKFVVSREWAKIYTIEYERTSVDGYEVGFGSQAISLKSVAEESIRNQYSIREENKEVYNEEVELEIPAFTKLIVIFRWKRIWQHGVMRMKGPDDKNFTLVSPK